MKGASATRTEEHPSSAIWKDIAIAVPAATVGIAAIRVLIASTGDGATFRALVSTLNISGLLIATSVPALPYLALIAPVLVVYRIRQSGHGTPAWLAGRRPWAWFGAAAILTILSAPMFEALAIVSVAAFSLWLLTRRSAPAKQPQLTSVLLVILIAFTAVALLAFTPLWVPAEVASVVPGEPRHVIYVLKGDTDQATILDTTTSTVRVVKADEITDRLVCNQNEGYVRLPGTGILDQRTVLYYLAPVLGLPRFQSPSCRSLLTGA